MAFKYLQTALPCDNLSKVNKMKIIRSVHNDPSLADKTYPFGEKNYATARCYCGDVEIEVKTNNPISTGFCHCVGCRTAHAAPMYHVLYCVTGNIDCRTGKKKKGLNEIQIMKGFQRLISVKRNQRETNGNTLLDRDVNQRCLAQCNALPVELEC